LLTPSFVILFLSSDNLGSSCMKVVVVVVSVDPENHNQQQQEVQNE
jgi:hypothetical protein